MRKISIHPISIVVWLWLLIMSGIVYAFNFVLAVVIHEFGHYAVAKILGYRLKKFAISPYGFVLKYEEKNFNYRDELKIAMAGPVLNFVSILIIFGLWWLFPTIYFVTESFVVVSLILALINLLPAYPLDGGRIFVDIASYFFDIKNAKKITMICNLLLSMFFLVCFIVCVFINFNPTYLLFSIFLMIGLFDLNFESKYEKINIFQKETKKFTRVDVCYVDLETTIGELLKNMQTSKTKMYYLILESGRVINLSEKMIIKFSTKFEYSCKLKDIFENNKKIC